MVVLNESSPILGTTRNQEENREKSKRLNNLGRGYLSPSPLSQESKEETMENRGRFLDMIDLHYLDERIRSHAPLRRSKTTPLPKDFQPSQWSVLWCGHGRTSFNHGEFMHYRYLVASTLL
jgi:hypothetical protein